MIAALLAMLITFDPSPDPTVVRHECRAIVRAIGDGVGDPPPPAMLPCTIAAPGNASVTDLGPGYILGVCIFAVDAAGNYSDCAEVAR